jgi:hypothetical protein
MKRLIRSFVVATVVGSIFFGANVAQAGPTYAQRQADQRRLETKRAAVKMEQRFQVERKELNDQLWNAIRRSQTQTVTPVPTPTPARQDPYETPTNQPGTYQPTTPAPMAVPYRQDPYEPATSQPGTYQPTPTATPGNATLSNAEYKMSLQDTVARYDRLLDFCRANPGTTPQEQASNDALIQTILRARANAIGYLQNLENQGR